MKVGDTLTECWIGELRLGPYSNDEWYGIGGIKNPIFQLIVARINDEVEFIEEFELFVHGGILEDWITFDADLFLIGPYEPEKIKSILDHIIKIGFEENLLCDISYQQGGWFDHYDNIEIPGECYLKHKMDTDKEMRAKGLQTEYLYRYDKFYSQGKLQAGKFFELPNGLFRRDMKVRGEEGQQKHLDRMETGYKYKWPVKLN